MLPVPAYFLQKNNKYDLLKHQANTAVLHNDFYNYADIYSAVLLLLPPPRHNAYSANDVENPMHHMILNPQLLHLWQTLHYLTWVLLQAE